jgi:acetyltransferase-like isoleucine patch superfamily enzyme
MDLSAKINQLLFNYEMMPASEVVILAKSLSTKMLRWLGANHPDNRTRKLFFEMTNVSIGIDTVINRNFIVSDSCEPLLKIGNRVAISPNVTIICESSPNNSHLNENDYVRTHLIKKEKVIIEDDVWIGTNAVILPGVIVGKSSIIGAGAVVTKSVKEYSIAVGVPAAVVREIAK